MANGWGGRREGAGRKPSPRADNENAPSDAPRKKAQERRPIDFAALAELVEQSRAAATNRPRTLEWCPYQIATHPPRAMPPKSSGLAMDDNSGLVGNNAWCQTEWMGGGMLSSAISEGMLFPGYPMLSEMAQRPEYRLASATISEEMTRKWFVFKGTGDKDKTEKIKELTDYLSDLKVRERFQQAALDDGFFGRSHIWLDCGDVNDEEQERPIGAGRKDQMTRGKVGRGWLKRLQMIEPVWVYPTTYNANNPMSADWYDPQVWYVMGRKVHRSRMPTFVGRPVPDLLKPAYSFGGLSLSQMGKPYVDIWLRTRESVAEIVRSFSVMVLKTDLETILAPGGGAELIARVMAFNAMRDNQGTLVINNATEDFQNIAAPVSGLDHLQAQAQEHMCSVWRIPTVKFTGIQPTGLNASSDGEIRVFHETIAAYQESFFGENLDFVIDVAQLSLWGEIDPEIVREWVPLWSMSEKEEAEVRKIETETDEKNVAMGALSPEEVRTRLANDPGSPYAGLDPEDVPDLMEEEEQGLEPLGGRPQPIAQGAAKEPKGADAAFREEDHPRAPDGKFGTSGDHKQTKKEAKRLLKTVEQSKIGVFADSIAAELHGNIQDLDGNAGDIEAAEKEIAAITDEDRASLKPDEEFTAEADLRDLHEDVTDRIESVADALFEFAERAADIVAMMNAETRKEEGGPQYNVARQHTREQVAELAKIVVDLKIDDLDHALYNAREELDTALQQEEEAAAAVKEITKEERSAAEAAGEIFQADEDLEEARGAIEDAIVNVRDALDDIVGKSRAALTAFTAKAHEIAGNAERTRKKT